MEINIVQLFQRVNQAFSTECERIFCSLLRDKSSRRTPSVPGLTTLELVPNMPGSKIRGVQNTWLRLMRKHYGDSVYARN
jgi:hypothetical protein